MFNIVCAIFIAIEIPFTEWFDVISSYSWSSFASNKNFPITTPWSDEAYNSISVNFRFGFAMRFYSNDASHSIWSQICLSIYSFMFNSSLKRLTTQLLRVFATVFHKLYIFDDLNCVSNCEFLTSFHAIAHSNRKNSFKLPFDSTELYSSCFLLPFGFPPFVCPFHWWHSRVPLHRRKFALPNLHPYVKSYIFIKFIFNLIYCWSIAQPEFYDQNDRWNASLHLDFLFIHPLMLRYHFFFFSFSLHSESSTHTDIFNVIQCKITIIVNSSLF